MTAEQTQRKLRIDIARKGLERLAAARAAGKAIP